MKKYDEIVNSILERRDKYIAKRKSIKKIIISTLSLELCCLLLITGLGLWETGYFSNNIPFSENSQGVSSNSNSDFSSVDNQTDSASDGNSSTDIPSNNPQGEFIPDNSTPSNPSDENPSEPSDNTPSTPIPSDPPVTETDYYINSIDKINFYAAKKIIDEKSLLPVVMRNNLFSTPNTLLLNQNYAEYPIDRNKIFTITMVTYFTIELNDEKGFLAQKLGGTGLVEVVVTKNNIDYVGELITFKRGDRYYSCLQNGNGYDTDTNIANSEFSSHKYIKGFNIIKNKEQENYAFTVHYDGTKVIGFECAPFHNSPSHYTVDDVTLIEDFCVVLFTKQTFTIEELEVYFKK